MTELEKKEIFNNTLVFYMASESLIEKLKKPFKKAAVDMNRKFDDIVDKYIQCHNQIVKVTRFHDAVERVLEKFEEKEKTFIEEYIIKNKTGFKVVEEMNISIRTVVRLYKKVVDKFFKLAMLYSYDFQQMLEEIHENRIIQ